MGPAERKTVIVVKKTPRLQTRHHGGAWKVAYADFVTAMMALFMVMWILGMDQQLRNSIEGYFSNPAGFKKAYTAGKSPLSSAPSAISMRRAPMTPETHRLEEQEFRTLSARIQSRLTDAGLASIRDRIEIAQTKTGLRIELADGLRGDDFFAMASSTMSESMRTTLEIVAHELAPLPNPVIIEGHTDAARYAGLYTNWELSTDRANAARRVLEANGLAPARVAEVRGMADRQLRYAGNPLDPRNRRITIFLPFTSASSDSTGAGAGVSTESIGM